MNIPTPHQVRETVHRSLGLLETLITLAEEKVTTFCDSLGSDLYEEAKALMTNHDLTAQQRRDFIGTMLADPDHLLHHYGKSPNTLLVWSDCPHS